MRIGWDVSGHLVQKTEAVLSCALPAPFEDAQQPLVPACPVRSPASLEASARRREWVGDGAEPGKSSLQHLVKVLRDHKAAMAADALKTGKTLPEHVFMSRCHKPHELSWVRKVFSNYLKDAGLRAVPFHAIRHFFASVLIGNGASLTYVKEQMVHSSFRITVDTYGHLVSSANRAEVNKLDDVGSWKSATQAQPDPAAVGLRLQNTLINREYLVEEEILRTQADTL